MNSCLTLLACAGFVGMSLAQAGAEVVLTDGSQQVVDKLHANVNQNQFPITPEVRRLQWGNPEDFSGLAGAQFDLIVASECVYGESAGKKPISLSS